ncbi:hypothetical protein [Gordoniibacillus kamchatkensis]|uniref:hypothetical protein n=1 Tax=Gordoniibacillus kamchatkensis TaxID=1590651 RepID=UPI0006989076|nr:hypothetical protein [Paenibacillus sp. VKM B-2647]
MDSQALAVILKEYEGYCYQIAYYLLQRENSAADAAKKALLELARTPGFLTEPAAERRQRAKRAAIKHALTVG